MTKKLTPEEKAANKAKKQAAKAASSKPAKVAKVAKPKKSAKEKAGKKPRSINVKPYAKDPSELATAGHNSGKINQALLDDIVEIEGLMANQKEIAKAIRDKVTSARDRHGISSKVLKHEINLRKMDTDVRADFEHGVKDLESMIGYQLALALDTPEDGEEGEEQLDGYNQVSEDDDNLRAAGGMH